MSTTVGLYYPFIHFQDEAWLKTAALYWDGMGRIVPHGYQTHDSDTVKRLAQELGFVRDFSPGGEAQTIGQEFVALIEQHYEALQQRYSLDHIDSWPADYHTVQNVAQRDPRLAYVSDVKMWWDLVTNLRDLRLATVIADYSGAWVGMHPKLASVYMSALAVEMAERRYLSPVTDDTVDHLAAGGWTMERLAAILLDDPTLSPAGPTAQEVEGGLANIALMAELPDLDHIPVEKIIAVRAQLQEERLAFQDSVRMIANDESWLQDVAPDAVQWQLEILYKNRLKPHLDKYEESLGLLGIPARRGIVSLLTRMPTFMVEAAKAVGWTLNPLVGAVTTVASFVLIPVLRPKSDGNVDTEAPPMAYLFDLKQALTPRTVSQELVSGAKRVTAQGLSEFGRQEQT